MTTIAIDGRICAANEARVSVLDHGLLYGDGVFEGIRVNAGAVFRLDDHLRRLEIGAAAIGLALPGGVARMREIVLSTCRAHGRDDAYIRLVVTRGEGPLGVDPTTCKDPVTICIVSDITLFPAEKRARGLDMITASNRKPGPDQLDPRVKSLNYLNSVLAKRESRLRGADEALVLNVRGLVAEAAVANVFVAQRGELLTPPTTDGALGGITRRSVLELAARLGVPAREASLSRFDLLEADECFLTGTGARIVPVATLDGVTIGTGERPLMRRIDEAFVGLTRELGTPFRV
ncbi:MAG: aminotransferase class IV [Polyangiales bacterium]